MVVNVSLGAVYLEKVERFWRVAAVDRKWAAWARVQPAEMVLPKIHIEGLWPDAVH